MPLTKGIKDDGAETYQDTLDVTLMDQNECFAYIPSLMEQYENLNMKDNEKVLDHISRVIVVTNKMKACGETLSEQVIIEKVLRSLTPQFDYIVVAIKHSKYTITVRIEELQSSLEAQELRLTEMISERESALELTKRDGPIGLTRKPPKKFGFEQENLSLFIIWTFKPEPLKA